MAQSKQASQFVQDDPVLGRLFGKEGLQADTLADLDKARGEESRLSSQGYKLQPEDFEAYGQASGDIARLFGQSEQDLSQSLAARGLSQAPSGAAAREFSGLQGNKMEMLAKAQTNIADQRMKNTMDRLNSTRNFMSQLGNQSTQLGQLGNQAIGDQFGRQRSKLDDLSGVARAEQGVNQQRAQSLQDKRDSQGQTLFGSLGRGLSKAFEAAPGQLVGSLFGGKNQDKGEPRNRTM
jgi:hypothetical protein